jgi:hypothetical protein
MSWSVVPFGKYAGKTLPEIIVLDLDWFLDAAKSSTADSGQRPVTWREGTRHQNSKTAPAKIRGRVSVRRRQQVLRLCIRPKLGVGIRDGQSDFRTSTWRRRLFVGRSITNEQAAS